MAGNATVIYNSLLYKFIARTTESSFSILAFLHKQSWNTRESMKPQNLSYSACCEEHCNLKYTVWLAFLRQPTATNKTETTLSYLYVQYVLFSHDHLPIVLNTVVILLIYTVCFEPEWIQSSFQSEFFNWQCSTAGRWSAKGGREEANQKCCCLVNEEGSALL